MDTAPVILIDDDSELLRATRQTLELAGFSVSAFAVAAEALDGLDANFSGVVVSDIRMPGIDGLQLFDRVLRLDPDIPVILVTGHGDIAVAVRRSRTAPTTSSPSRSPPTGWRKAWRAQRKSAAW